MTEDRQLSQLIEPEEGLPYSIILYPGTMSPLKAWYWDGEQGWQPRSWRTEENASAMLLEMLLDESYHLNFVKQSTGQMLLWINAEEHYLAPDRKTAIFNAALAWAATPEGQRVLQTRRTK